MTAGVCKWERSVSLVLARWARLSLKTCSRQGAGRLRLYDKDPLCGALLALPGSGAEVATTVGEVVEEGGVVFSMVTNDDSLRDIALSKAGILARLGRGGVHVSMSTVSLAITRELAVRYAEQGSHFVSAPVLGRPDAAAEATWMFLFLARPLQKNECGPCWRFWAECGILERPLKQHW